MIRFGDIVLIEQLTDRSGRNPKDRPAVVVTPGAELTPGFPIQVVAISTLVPTPLPPDHVLMP